ncbi:demethylmenaquinone methyltransferase [Acidocella aquatica]|uniref:Demethylmenaquinone methyltransferase n=1 Tax=Acidocella aquatica TaxID=1922313 RepID=A0ABQ6A3B6_9PROT|nr:demethylmenaquinone methyltransferase [Acidocella aquatica]
MVASAYFADPARRLSFVRDLFNRSAQHYDGVNRLFSLGSGAWYRRTSLRKAGVRPGVKIVDVAVGTGLLAREAITLTGDLGAVIGVDVSEAMLAIARKNLGIRLIQATAEALPLAPDIADFVTMGYALRHLADIEAALREAMRILRPGGTILLLEISAPRKRLSRILAAAYIGGILPLLSLLMTRERGSRALMRYHWKTIANCMPPDAIMRVLTESGFLNVRCVNEFDLFQRYTAQKPDHEPA